MARVDDAELARLKSEVSLVRLVEAKGIALVKHGAGGDLVACCPFHEDRTPSFVVSPSKNLWRCHGACQVGGSVVDFVMRVEAVSFRHAVDLLRQGVTSGPVEGPLPKASSVAKLPPLAPPSIEDRELLVRVVGFYAETLVESPEALGYLARRRIDLPEAVTSFRLGYENAAGSNESNDAAPDPARPGQQGRRGAPARAAASTRLNSLSYSLDHSLPKGIRRVCPSPCPRLRPPPAP